MGSEMCIRDRSLYLLFTHPSVSPPYANLYIYFSLTLQSRPLTPLQLSIFTFHSPFSLASTPLANLYIYFSLIPLSRTPSNSLYLLFAHHPISFGDVNVGLIICMYDHAIINTRHPLVSGAHMQCHTTAQGRCLCGAISTMS